jgi:hypothetical protein
VADLAKRFRVGRDLLGDFRVSLCPLDRLSGFIGRKTGDHDDTYAMSSNISMPGSPMTPACAIAACSSGSAVKASACSTVGKWWVMNTRLWSFGDRSTDSPVHPWRARMVDAVKLLGRTIPPRWVECSGRP